MRNWIVVSLLLVACGNHSVPKEVLPPEKMQAVLYDMIRTDELVDFLRMSDSTYQLFSKRTALYDSVFSVHGVTKETFRKSLKYYQHRPDLLQKMMNDLHTEVTDTTKKRPTKAIR